MASQLTVETVEERGDYHHVRFRDPDTFEQIRTPEWATNIARSVVPESKVRMGGDDDGEWIVQSVLIPTEGVDGGDDASRNALEIVTKISD